MQTSKLCYNSNQQKLWIFNGQSLISTLDEEVEGELIIMVTKTSFCSDNGEYDEGQSPEEDTHVFLWWWNFQLERIKAVKASWKCLQIFLCVKIVQFLKLPKLNSPHHRLYLLLRLLLANIYTTYYLKTLSCWSGTVFTLPKTIPP